MIRVVEGACDLLPPDMLLQKWLSQQIESVLSLYGYQPWDSPLLEYRSLYTQHSNEDLVNSQAFTFLDIKGNEVVLRSELTPSLARVVAMHAAQSLPLPLRWYAYGPFWRNENLSPGRGREFRQWNIDTVGIPQPIADVEMILQVIHHLESFGFQEADVVIKLNNRALLRHNMAAIGIAPEKFHLLERLLDRAAKSPQFNFLGEAAHLLNNSEQLQALKQYLANSSMWMEDDLLVSIFAAAKRLGQDGFLQYDPMIVRFPRYYTGLVFEAYDREGKFPAILGGGRYDLLVEQVGGVPIPAAGFAIGNITLVELLREKNMLPSIQSLAPNVLVCAQNTAQLSYAVQFAQKLRRQGWSVEISPQLGQRDLHLDYARRHLIQQVAYFSADDLEDLTISFYNFQDQEEAVMNSLLDALDYFCCHKHPVLHSCANR